MRQIDRCSSCGAQIVWLRTLANHPMPVNAETATDQDYQFKPGIHMPHWATCPFADEHRRKKRAQKKDA